MQYESTFNAIDNILRKGHIEGSVPLCSLLNNTEK